MNPHDNSNSKNGDFIRRCNHFRHQIGVFFLRVCVAIMMLVHGLPKFMILLGGGGEHWADPLGIGPRLSLVLCAAVECLCSLGLMLGFFTRLCALILAITMWIIIFMVHGAQGWPYQELPMLYLVCFVTIIFTGSGIYSLDHKLRGDKTYHSSKAPVADASTS